VRQYCLWYKGLEFKVRLREMLEARGRSRYWLAKETGIQYGTLLRIERAGASNRIQIGTLDKTCCAPECQPGDLLVWREEASAGTKKLRRLR
jgi:putative transcriptional regulator